MMSSADSRPPQSLAANLALGLAVGVLFLGAAEGVARLVEKPRPAVLPEKRPLLWDEGGHGEFYTMRSSAVGWPPWEEFNRDGVRDRTHAKEKPEGTWRVVCLGDSVTLGPDGRPQHAYPQILQAKLDALGPGVEVFNVSLWGWATRQERTAYRRIARKYRPDQVLLGICLNDFADTQNSLSRPSPVVAGLYRRSALVRRIVRAEERQIAGVEELFAAPDARRVREAFARVFAEVRALREEVRADGAELVVLVFPFRGQVRADAPPPLPEERIASFCAREGIRLLDLLPGLSPLGEAAFLEGDGVHLDEPGAARVAEEVLRSGLIPEEAYSTRRLRSALGLEGLDPRAVPALTRALESADPRVRAQAAWALGRIGPAAKAAVFALAKAVRDGAESVRLSAAVALGQIGPEARPVFEALAKGLEDERESVRARSAEAIFRIGPEAAPAVPVLRAALQSEDLYVRGFAAWYLGELGTAARAALPDLALTLKRDDGGVRALAVRTLVKIAPGDPAAVVALAESLRRSDWDQRWRAARVLGRMGAPAVPVLVAALADPDETVRREAAAALGHIGSAASAAAPALVEAQKDADAAVRTTATEALRKVTPAP